MFFGPSPWHIEIRHRVKKTPTINLFGFETLKLKIRRLKLWKPTVAALAMGDSLAVELAQASHLGLLQQEVGACRASELVVYRAPFPRGPSWEILAIGDHVGIQAVSPATPPSARRDREVFQKADTVYPAVGLCQHPKKKIREADNHTVVGGEIEGRIGTIAAPRLRTAVLIAPTLGQFRLRTYSPTLHLPGQLLGPGVSLPAASPEHLHRDVQDTQYCASCSVRAWRGGRVRLDSGRPERAPLRVLVGAIRFHQSPRQTGCVGVRYGRV